MCDNGLMFTVVCVLLMGAQPGDVPAKDQPVDLLAQLKSKSSQTRLQAMKTAAANGAVIEPKVIRAIVECTDDADPKIRRQAVQTIGEIGPRAREFGGGPKLGEILVKLFQDKDTNIRSGAVWTYGQIGIDTREELDAIATMLRDKSAAMRGWALMSLGQYLHDATPKDWRLAAEEQIAELLSDKDARVQKVAGEQLLAAGSETVPILMRVLENPKGDARLWAALVLGELGAAAQPAVPALQKVLNDVPANRRHILQTALRKIQS
jgi:HEAT repeat protein